VSVFKVRDDSTLGGGNDQSGPAPFGAAANCYQFSGVIVSSELDGAESGQRFHGGFSGCGSIPVTDRYVTGDGSITVNIGGEVIVSHDPAIVARQPLNAFDRVKFSGRVDHPWVEQIILNFFFPHGAGIEAALMIEPARRCTLPPAGLYLLGAGGDTLATGRIQNFREELTAAAS